MSFVGHPQSQTIMYARFKFLVMASRHPSSCLMSFGVQCRQPFIFVNNECLEISMKITFMKLKSHAQCYVLSVLGMYLKIEYLKGLLLCKLMLC
jgi:hypothetical protein